MPPTLVRPQTFTVLQQPDSASPAVRFESRTAECSRPSSCGNSVPAGGATKTYSICVLQGCANPLPCQLIPIYRAFRATGESQVSSRLGLLFRLRFGWVNDQKYHTTRQTFPPVPGGKQLAQF